MSRTINKHPCVKSDSTEAVKLWQKLFQKHFHLFIR